MDERRGKGGEDVKGNMSKGMDTVRRRNGALRWEVADR